MSSHNPPTEAWYTRQGPDSDTVLSTRTRLIRNLGGFVFPGKIKSDDAERVLSLVFDAFNHIHDTEEYQKVRMSALDARGRSILAERGVIEPGSGNEPWKGVIVRNDGTLAATINIEDHLRVASFAPGLSVFASSSAVNEIDSILQKKLQFSALPGIGYLAQDIHNTGSGMKISVLCSLQGLFLNEILDRVIREYLAQGFSIRGYFGTSQNGSLGCLYQLSGGSCSSGDIQSQISRMEQAAGKLAVLERRCRADLIETRKTEIEDIVFRALAISKYARYIGRDEAINLIEQIRLGLNLDLVTGIENIELTALLYRIQTAHLSFVISSGSIIIEEDVRQEEQKLDRLRAMVIQEVLKYADIQEKRN